MTTPTGKSALTLPEGYADWLAQLKGQIVQARQRASLSVNAELVQLYGRVGRDILERQQTQGWGAKVIDRLALDLKDAFTDMRGWSSRNLKYMRFFAQHCPDGLFGQQPAAQLPWFHIVTVLTQLSDAADREWYAVQTVAQGWSRTTLSLNIKNRLHLRQGLRSPTSRPACPPRIRRWRTTRLKTRICSTFSGWATMPTSARLKAA
jgi:predicted nuclease of restriction endonuclease-like (RecB) superfamily